MNDKAEQKPAVSALTKTMLESGIIDEGFAALLEAWGYLPDGATKYVNNDALKMATRSSLKKLAEKIGDAVEKSRELRETRLDIDQMKWPMQVYLRQLKSSEITRSEISATSHTLVTKAPYIRPAPITALVDKLGRFYFQPNTIKEAWFVPGETIISHQVADERNYITEIGHLVEEAQFLYSGEAKLAFQVSCDQTELTLKLGGD